MHHDVSFDDQNTLRSNQFGDIYFSTQDGVAETTHVFLKNNNLPQAWKNQKQFTIAETGFGSGLNILCAWKLFDDTAKEGQRLDIISTEKYPLSPQEIAKALSPFKEIFGNKIDRLLQQYPLRIPGFHRLWLSDQVTLTLIFDDATTGLSQIDTPIDAWFLDGFAPAKNPQMWSSHLFEEMARLSHDQTTFATFTAAGDVRRGLEKAGFDVEKTKGFGRKRDMLIGRFTIGKKSKKPEIKKVAIIGGGIAGTATAFCLKRRGMDVTLFEEKDRLGQGSSSNQTALINPKLFADLKATQTQIGSTGYSFLLKQLATLSDIEFMPKGSVYLGHTEQKTERYQKFADRLGWHPDHLHPITKEDIQDKIGYQTPLDGIVYPDAATVNPQKLCRVYAQNIPVKFGQKISIDDLQNYDAIILAHGVGALTTSLLKDIPFKSIRGQVTTIQHPSSLPKLEKSFSFGNYVTATKNGTITTGATFDHNEDTPLIKSADDDYNLSALKKALPDFDQALGIVDQWAGIRCGTKDYLPVIGSLPDHTKIYTLLGLGSSGTINSLIGGEILASMITNAPLPLGREAVKALSPCRFLNHDKKKHDLK